MFTGITITETEVVGSAITEAHFGLNFVADAESIGPKPWAKLDDIVKNLNLQNLRYPGGVSAETLFDYRNPNSEFATSEDGSITKMTPLISYIQYCNLEGINPTIIVPTAVFLTDEKIANHRTFDESQADSAFLFIQYILQATDPALTVSFEIGNEYESHMTSTEYGRVANRLTEIVTSATDALNLNQNVDSALVDPKIFVQSWGYSVGGGLTVADLEERNARVIGEFSNESLANIDGVVSHYYYSDGRNIGTDQEQSFSAISEQVKAIARLHSAWNDATGRDLLSRVSEWNVQFKSVTELGLMQISPLMEMFTSFVQNGVDLLDFWSAQYHATSLASSNGRLMAAGALFDTLKPYLIDTKAGASTHTDDLSTYTFMADGRLIAVISSEQASRLTIDPALSNLPTGLHLVDGFIIGVDEATADGIFKDLQGLQPYGEPDASITVTQVPGTFVQGGQSLLVLEPYETVILIFSADQENRRPIYGSDTSDLLYASGQLSQFIGRGGLDVVSYVQSTTGVFADLQVSNDPTGAYKYDLFVSIEALIGSSHDDELRGSFGNDRIDGWSADDLITGFAGNDVLLGGSGNDTIFGGSGDDSLRGGPGDDSLIAGGGFDSVFGDDGYDTLSFANSEQAANFWLSSEAVETVDAVVLTSSVEDFVGTSSDDLFDLGKTSSTVHGLAGNDEFRVLTGGRHSIHAGDGDDTVLVYAGMVSVYGEAGDDFIFSTASLASLHGGDGRDQITALGVGNVIDGGRGDDLLMGGPSSDTFVFSSASDNDTVVGFQPHLDAVLLQGSSLVDVWMEQTVSGSRMYFSGESSIFFENVFLDSIASVRLFFDDIV